MKKSIKLIAVDLDGTLLNSESRISNKNKRAIRECLNKGIKVVLSTGTVSYTHLTLPTN